MLKPLIIHANESVKKFTNYDNLKAYEQLLAMMKRGDILTISGKSDQYGHAYLEIQSPRVAKFKYYVNDNSLNGVIKYMETGKYYDFDENPMDILVHQAGTNFPTWLVKGFVESNANIQYVPFSREYRNSIAGIIPMFRGKIHFFLPRTEENFLYFINKQQII